MPLNLIYRTFFLSLVLSLLASIGVNAQMRKLFSDEIQPNNVLAKIDFYSPSEGYAAFNYWLGFTTDSGRTFTKKFVLPGNVDYRGNFVNLTFGFYINGVHAFDRNTLVLYGHYGFVPAILYSADGGGTFTLVFHSQYQFEYSTGINDMIFPGDGDTGYAVDNDRIIKTVDGGKSWHIINLTPRSLFTRLQTVDNNTIIAICNDYSTGKIWKSANGGATWENISLPADHLNSAFFLSPQKGWVSMYDNDSRGKMYTTSDGGANWTKLNDEEGSPFRAEKFQFIDASNGYALARGPHSIFTTTDGGRIWEPLQRDNPYEYVSLLPSDLFIFNSNQIWAGGARGYLEMTTNGGGRPLPAAMFKITGAASGTGVNISLTNFSKPGYTFQWFRNKQLSSTAYHYNYFNNSTAFIDTITLVASNGVFSDTLTRLFSYFSSVKLTDFNPKSGKTGSNITITSTSSLITATAVTFGGTPAVFKVLQGNTIVATVGNGSSGAVEVITEDGIGVLNGFTYYPTPTITSFTPTSSKAGNVVAINGTNFQQVTSVKFGGVEAAFTVVSSNLINAIVPSSQPGTVEVTTNGGTATGGGFVAIPEIKSFNPSNGTEGTSIVINGTSLTTANKITVGGVQVKSFIVNSSTKITAVVAAGASGDVSVTTTGGVSTMPGFTWNTLPSITSFTPAAGVAGSSVVISGNNFDPVPGNNVVYFGGVRANVNAATATSLNVTVPVAASYQPITVTRHNLTAYSKLPFRVTYNGDPGLSDTTYQTRLPIDNGNNLVSWLLRSGDMDGDGKIDLVSINGLSAIKDNNIGIARNIGSGGNIAFEPNKAYHVAYPGSFAIGDIDGDGKLDFAATDNDRRYVLLFRNTSTPGSLSFSGPDSMYTGRYPGGIAIGDLDLDGKADIVTTGRSAHVFRNIGYPGHFDFAKSDYSFFGREVFINDLNNDGRPEVMVLDYEDSIYILQNNSSPGNIVLNPAITISSGASYDMAVGDVDNDGLLDMVYVEANGPNMQVLRNTSAGTTISFAPNYTADAGFSPAQVRLGDLDGDGKTDIAVVNSDHNLSVFKNNSTRGTISLGGRIDVIADRRYEESSLTICDINGDGQDDPIISREGLFVFLKTPPPPSVPVTDIQHFSPREAALGTKVNITGKDFIDVTSVTFGGMDAAYFNVVSDSLIIATVGKGATGRVAVIGKYGADSLDGFTYKLWDTARADACPNVDVVLFSYNRGSHYQWQLNTGDGYHNVSDDEHLRGTNSNELYIDNIPPSWDGYIFICLVDGVQGSHFTVINIHQSTVVPSFSISVTDSLLCPGSMVTFTPTLTGGTLARYAWQVNGLTVLENSGAFQSNTLHGGDLVRAIVTAQGSCLSVIKDTSNEIRLIARDATEPSISIAGKNAVTANEQVILTSTVQNAGSSVQYQWSDSTKTHGWENIPGALESSYTYSPASTGDKIRCELTSAACGTIGTFVSNEITFTIGNNAVVSPNPARSFLNIGHLNVRDEWRELQIVTLQGKVVLTQNVTNQTSIKVDIQSLRPGLYMAVLRNGWGAPIYVKFLKM